MNRTLIGNSILREDFVISPPTKSSINACITQIYGGGEDTPLFSPPFPNTGNNLCYASGDTIKLDFNQPISIFGMVGRTSDSPSPHAPPTGEITFSDDGKIICTQQISPLPPSRGLPSPSLSSSGAICQIKPPAPVKKAALTISYSGDANYPATQWTGFVDARVFSGTVLSLNSPILAAGSNSYNLFANSSDTRLAGTTVGIWSKSGFCGNESPLAKVSINTQGDTATSSYLWSKPATFTLAPIPMDFVVVLTSDNNDYYYPLYERDNSPGGPSSCEGGRIGTWNSSSGIVSNAPMNQPATFVSGRR